MTQRINLQSTPDPEGLIAESVTFPSSGSRVEGMLYRPAEAAEPAPAAVVTGAWTTVKEQMAGTYARELAARGVAALAFDFRGWGASEGEPRFVEDPLAKIADIVAAAEFMMQRTDVAVGALSGLGICASSGYMASAVASLDSFSKLALVAPWLHTPSMAERIYRGAEAAAELIAASDAAEASREPVVLTAASPSDESAPMYGAPYYTEEERGLIPEYDNKFSTASWRPWLTYDAHASASKLSKPTLLVGSAGMALPTGAEEYERHCAAPLEKLWLNDDVSQFDFYDQADVVLASVDAVARFFREESK